MNNNLNLADDLGYYCVGDQTFTHKISALVAATKTDTYPTWHYHSDVYSKINWQQDLDISLDQIYQMRAQQLRDQYDHLVLSFSGGSDSWTAVKAFIDSGTHLDEIFVRYPFRAGMKHHVVSRDLSASNSLSEWELTVKPMLTEIANQLPNTLITIEDYTTDIEKLTMSEEDWVHMNDWLNPTWFLKINMATAKEIKIARCGKRSAFIVGVDKPQLWYRDNTLYCVFLDKMTASQRRPLVRDVNRTTELFYWTPNMPEITLLQSRAIYQMLKQKPHLTSLIDISKPHNPDNKRIWDQVVREIIYDQYVKLNAFQTYKPTSSIYDESESWIFNCNDLEWLQSWKHSMNSIFANIDSKFFEKRNNVVHGFIGFFDGMYPIGQIGNEAIC